MKPAYLTTSFLKEVRFGGQRIILGDQSIWEVSPRQRDNTWFWRLTAKITIVEGIDPSYPYHLINLELGDIIDARPVEVLEPV